AASGTRANSGAAFLAAKKQARDDARAALLASAEAADEAFHLLASAARATRRREGEPQGAASPPLLDAAFLVPSTSIARFKAAARRAAARCADAGAELTLTGPWPAYNFVQLGERR
ncbi:MAG TPA: GvpL/GvpF family gas vesicle protein, partial [Vicinamibacterales bacterium]